VVDNQGTAYNWGNLSVDDRVDIYFEPHTICFTNVKPDVSEVWVKGDVVRIVCRDINLGGVVAGAPEDCEEHPKLTRDALPPNEREEWDAYHAWKKRKASEITKTKPATDPSNFSFAVGDRKLTRFNPKTLGNGETMLGGDSFGDLFLVNGKKVWRDFIKVKQEDASDDAKVDDAPISRRRKKRRATIAKQRVEEALRNPRPSQGKRMISHCMMPKYWDVHPDVAEIL
jgi:hypothetical protein